jgi:hypothetical protein
LKTLYVLKVWLRGCADELFFEVPEYERNRLLERIQCTEDEDFVIFETSCRRIAMCLGDVMCIQFLEDYQPLDAERAGSGADDDDDYSPAVEVYFTNREKPSEFDLDPAIHHPATGSPAGGICDVLDALLTVGAESERLRFIDVDGEEVFLRRGDLAIISVALDYT